MNRIKGFIYDIITFFACIVSQKRNKTEKVLFIRVDEIGDYILWRKFILELLTAPVCHQKEVHFVGNAAWKSLFELEFDTSIFSKIHWLNKNLYKTSIAYRYQFSKCIYQEGYSAVINPTYSRAKRVDDSIVKAAKALDNYGFIRNNENYLDYEQAYDKNLYTHLLPIFERPVFEFNRNKEFTQWITKQPSQVNDVCFSAAVELPETKYKYALPSKYLVVFPGSRSPKRIWSASYFAEVCNYIFNRYHLTVVLAGASSDIHYGDDFNKYYTHPTINLIGSTTLAETVSVIKGANCLLSVDTGSIHMAATVNCLSLGIFNGSQYGRFSPYPQNISNKIISAYPTSIANDIANAAVVKDKYEHIVNIDYNQVTPAQIIAIIEKENLFNI